MKKSNVQFIRKVRTKKPSTNKSTRKKTSTKNINNTQINNEKLSLEKPKKEFPTEFPFWARLKIDKNRTTLVIDEAMAYNKKTKKFEAGFVDREAIHTYRKDYEEVSPNPDEEDTRPMYLKRPTKKPKRLFVPHNKDLNMPEYLKDRYDKNNHK